MHILLTTYGLLMIMALFAMAQWKHAETMIFTDAVASSQFQKSQQQILDKLTMRTSEIYRKAAPKENDVKTPKEEKMEENKKEKTPFFFPDDPDPMESSDSQKKGRRSHLLSVAPLFCDKNASRVDGKGKVCFALLKNLLDALYSKQEFYIRYQKANPNLHEDLILAMMDKAKEAAAGGIKLNRAKKLTKLELDDEILKEVRRKEFMGNKSVNDKQSSSLGYYPLYEFISVQQTSHLVSLWLAPKALLYAIFQNDETVNKLCELRDTLYNERRREKKNKDSKTIDDLQKQKLEEFFKSHQTDFIDSQLFDFATSSTKPPKY